MTPKKTLKIAGGIAIAIILIYSFLPGEKVPYQETILVHREEIRDFMKNDEESPLSDTLKSGFDGFDYFIPDPAFRIKATLDRIPGNLQLSMPTNDGEERVYIKYAFARFEYSGNQYQLTLLKPEESEQDDRLFLPFGDLTNGITTYGGGRYLDLDPVNGKSIIIDFNLAYNPYCAYGAAYSCPLPPPENRLPFSVNAGEMNFH